MNDLVIILFLAVVVIGVGLLVLISVTRKGPSKLDQEKYRSRWLAITGSTTETAESWQFAVINADKLLDQALKERGLRGETMGERLKQSKGHLSQLDAVWKAHKLRNRIAHDDGTVSKRESAKALETFKRALQDMGAL
ncbi:MAG TPA: hypothetical protein VF597_01010 [Candidatus Saccharimonadales bacterium]|jgi:hypothetical protein